MEVFLNLAWMVVALFLIELRRRTESRTGAQRRNSLIALAMLLVILFPVISVSDDLWSIQYPAETDTALRRNQLDAGSHGVFTAIALPTPAFVGGLEFPRVDCIVAPVSAPRAASPLFASILNRPPPNA